MAVLCFSAGVLPCGFSSAQDAGNGDGLAGPTPAEVESLVYLNRLRVDPGAEAFLLAGMGRRALDIPDYVDLDLFVDELLAAEPVPPVFFDARLVAASRHHSRYMIAHGQGHEEDPALEHYTGRRHPDRIQAAGFDAFVSGENVFIAALSPLQGHAGFVIDWGWEEHPGGMQPGRGHRANMLSPQFRQVGIAVVDWHEEAFGRDLQSVTHNYGTSRLGRRLVGGVVYTDRNRNGRYDAGEGEGGVSLVASDGSEATSWASGAYTLELSRHRAVTITASKDELARTFEVAEGRENVQVDWVLPRVERDAVRRALEAVLRAEGGNGDVLARARLALWLVVQDYAVPEEMAERVAGQTAGVGEGVAASRRRVFDALIGPADGLAPARRLIQSERRAYAGTSLGEWYAQAETARRVLEGAARRADDLAEGADPERRRRALGSLYEQLEGVTDPALRAVVRAVLRP